MRSVLHRGRRFRTTPAGDTMRVPTTDPQGVAWSVELRSSGRVCADVRRGRASAYAALCAFFSAVWLAGLFVGDGWGRAGWGVLLVLTALMTALFVRQALRLGSWRSPQVVVDAEGLTLRHGMMRVPWPHLCGAVAYTANHNRWVDVVTTDELYDAWLADRPAVQRLLARRWRNGPGRVQLPPNLDVDTEAFAAWLTHEAADRMRAAVRWPAPPDAPA